MRKLRHKEVKKRAQMAPSLGDWQSWDSKARGQIPESVLAAHTMLAVRDTVSATPPSSVPMVCIPVVCVTAGALTDDRRHGCGGVSACHCSEPWCALHSPVFEEQKQKRTPWWQNRVHRGHLTQKKKKKKNSEGKCLKYLALILHLK